MTERVLLSSCLGNDIWHCFHFGTPRTCDVEMERMVQEESRRASRRREYLPESHMATGGILGIGPLQLVVEIPS